MRDRRTSWLCTLAAAALLAPAAGCIITDGDDDPRPCYELPIEPISYRNPETGTCESVGGGGGCDDGDDDVVYGADESGASRDWAVCWSACEGLDENSCLATPGCRGAYEGFVCPPNADCIVPDQLRFIECWATAPSGPVQGDCWGLEANGCSRHDDCIALYNYGDEGDSPPQLRKTDSPTPQRQFTQCAPEPAPTEPGCYSDEDCGDGYECTSIEECLPAPGCDDLPCPPVCYGRCVPVEPNPDPGECYGEVACDAAPPACPESTVPGVEGNCWSGYCIPTWACEEAPVPECIELDEQTCSGRADCQPIYEGEGCTCTADGSCQCNDWHFKICGTTLYTPFP